MKLYDRSYYMATSQIFSNTLHHCRIFQLSLISPSSHKSRSGICCRTRSSSMILMVCSILQWNSALAALILLWWLFFTQPFCEASGSKCFTRDGNSSSDLPCNPNQSQSFCCGSGWACLTNGICASTPSAKNIGDKNMLARGSCTDKLWASTSQCPDFCLGPS